MLVSMLWHVACYMLRPVLQDKTTAIVLYCCCSACKSGSTCVQICAAVVGVVLIQML